MSGTKDPTQGTTIPKWTPGPWKASPRGSFITSAVFEKLDAADWGYEINMLSPPWALGSTGAAVCTAVWPAEESVANAHLIAAAPELYAALQDLITYIEYSDNTDAAIFGTEHHFGTNTRKARAALAKARGGNPEEAENHVE